MSRKLTDHIIPGKVVCNEVIVEDEPGDGGACHVYQILGPVTDEGRYGVKMSFQNGPINENGNGANGIHHEDLLSILIDRMRGFQSGDYACRENAIALTNLEEALMWLQKRTRDRMARGVEGTHQR